MTGTERIRLENHIRDMANDLNSNYPGAISDEKIEDLVTKYMSLECSYDEAIKIVDDSLSGLIVEKANPEEAEKKFVTKMLDSYNQHSVANTDKFLGNNMNSQMIDIFNLYDQADDLDFSLEGKMLFFIRGRDELLKKYKEHGIKIVPGLEKVSFDDVKALYKNFIANVDVVADDLDTRMDMCVRSDIPLYIDGKFNKSAIDLSNAEKVFDFAIKNGKRIKLSNLLNADVFPLSLEKELLNKDSEECRVIVLDFINNYIACIAEWAEEKGYNFRHIDVVNDIVNQGDNKVLYKNNLWNTKMGRNTSNNDLYFIDFIRVVRQYFPNSELLLCENNEFLPENSSKIVAIMEYIKNIENRDGIKLIDALGLSSSYFDWNANIGRAVSASDIYDSSLDLFNIGLPLYRTNYEFKANMKDGTTKEELLHAIRIVDQYCDISGVIFSNNMKLLFKDDFEPNDDYIYYADIYSDARKSLDEEVGEGKDLTKTMVLKLMSSEEAPSGYILSNSLLVLIILIFACLIIVASILLN